MKRILRSIIDFGGTISPQNLAQNIAKVRDSRLEWERPEDEAIWKEVHGFYSANGEPPTIGTVLSAFGIVDEGESWKGDVEVAERLKDVATAEVFIRTNFHHLVEGCVLRQDRNKAVGVFKEAEQIITKGLKVDGPDGKPVKLEGIGAALTHALTRITPLVETGGTQTRGNIVREGQAVWDEYVNAKENPGAAYGVFTGINEIDTVCHGLKRGELHLHAGFPGELKSSFARTWAVNAVTRYRRNVCFVSLEMGYRQVRRLIYAIHSANPKFGEEPLDARRIRDGSLTPKEETFYQKVIQDFNTNPEHCELHVWRPDHDVSVMDIRAHAETLHQQLDVGLLIIDYAALIKPAVRKHEQGQELNGIVRDVQKLSRHFNRGEGVPTTLLFQTNRTGKVEADKNDGIYKLNALSWANEAERAADVITTTYLNDELRDTGATKVSCLKNRDNPIFPAFEADVNFAAGQVIRSRVRELHMGRMEREADNVLPV